MNTHPEEGDTCPAEGCGGTLCYPPVEGCRCHVNPPCSACTSQKLTCPECQWEEPDPEPEPPPTQAQRNEWVKYAENYEAARQRGHTFPHGGRVFNVRYDTSSGSTMVFTGQYAGPVTSSDIISYLGDGTFGHRGPLLTGTRFLYTKITD